MLAGEGNGSVRFEPTSEQGLADQSYQGKFFRDKKEIHW